MILHSRLMNKTLAATCVTIAIAALVTGMTTIGTAQTANAVGDDNTPNKYGKEQISGTAKTGNLGDFTSSCAVGNPCSQPGDDNTHNGIAEFRANGDKFQSGYDNGQGSPNFRP